MEGRDVIVTARRGAGLTQLQLAERLGRRQPTIAAWESGTQHPSFETVVQVVRACGQDLAVGLPNQDDSYDSQIAAQLRLSPSQRVASLSSHYGLDGAELLGQLARADARMVAVGRVAAAAQGWPVSLDDHQVEVVPEELAAFTALVEGLGFEPRPVPVLARHGWAPPPEDAFWVRDGSPGLLALSTPRRTRGYRDLARSADRLELDGTPVRVASLIDLIRIAEADPSSSLRSFRAALWATLQRRRGRRTQPMVAA